MSTGNYTVTIKDENDCTDVQDNIIVTSQVLPTAIINGDFEICKGENTTLTASGGTTYLWNNGDMIDSTIINLEGVYSVTVTDEFGCQNSDSVEVIAYSLPDVSLNLNKDTFCIDETDFELIGGHLLMEIIAVWK